MNSFTSLYRFFAYTVLIGMLRFAPEVCAAGADVPNIGDRRELLVDHFLIERLENASLKLAEPRLAPEVSSPRPHGHYATVLRSPDGFQFYYRGDKDPKVTWKTHGIEAYHEGEVTLYAESKDGILWKVPKLDLFAHPSFPEGNIVLMDEIFVNHNFTPFLDTRPGTPPSERYKALGGIAFQPNQKEVREKRGPGGLKAFVSPDGIHWKRLRDEPVIPEEWGKYFDSQNYAFWSTHEGRYVCYFRRFIQGVRGIARTTSEDFVHWTPFEEMKANLPGEQLYTSCTQPYYRAPHLYVATPTRFMDKRGAATDILFMTTRGGSSYERTFTQSFIRPGLGVSGWANRANYAAIGIHQTGPTEMSLFLTGGRRYTLRVDGFASLNAPLEGGEMLSKPFVFSGKELEINFSTSAAGRMRVEIQDATGRPLPGFELDACEPLWGDEISRVVQWKGAPDLLKFSGAPVRLRFELSDADLFSFRFRNTQ